jgi:hypothetical protein
MEVAGNLRRDSDIAIGKERRNDCDGGRLDGAAFGLPVDPAGARPPGSSVLVKSADQALYAAKAAGRDRAVSAHTDDVGRDDYSLYVKAA